MKKQSEGSVLALAAMAASGTGLLIFIDDITHNDRRQVRVVLKHLVC